MYEDTHVKRVRASSDLFGQRAAAEFEIYHPTTYDEGT